MKVLLIGGTRYFGKRLVHKLLQGGHLVWILSRGNTPDDFGDRVHRLQADRNDENRMKEVLSDLSFDVVVDQICMNAQQAEMAVHLLEQRAGYYIMTSTMSVYSWGDSLKEQEFDALKYTARQATNPAEEYAEGKRAAERVFLTQQKLRCAFPRFPLVVGEDDYTLRLYDHVRKIREGVPLYFPNLEARLSFILSEDAAQALLWLIETRNEGPYNFASREPLVLKELVSKIERITGNRAQLLTEASSEHWSSFGISQDWYLDVSKAEKEGFRAQDIKLWLEPLLEKLNKSALS